MVCSCGCCWFVGVFFVCFLFVVCVGCVLFVVGCGLLFFVGLVVVGRPSSPFVVRRWSLVAVVVAVGVGVCAGVVGVFVVVGFG